MGVHIRADSHRLTFEADRLGKFRSVVMKAIQDTAQIISEEIPEMVMNTVEHTPSALVPGKDNRVWTGYMRDHQTARVLNARGLSTTIQYGWINGYGGFSDTKGFYIADQEFGNSKRHIWGMNALEKVRAHYAASDMVAKEITETLEAFFK